MPPPSLTLQLPRQNKAILDDITQHTIIIAGEKGAGKTSFCLQYPEHFMLQCELGNASHLSGNYEDIPDIDYLEAFIVLLEKPENRHYCKTLIVDEIQIAYSYYCEKVRIQQKMDRDEKFTFDEWRIVSNYFSDFLMRLQRLPFGIVYTCHVEWNEVELRTGKKISRLEPRLSGQCNKILETILKLCGVMMMEPDSSRCMLLEGDEKVLAYNKFPNHFVNPITGKKHKKIPLGSDPKTAFDNFISAYNNNLAISTQPPQLNASLPANQQKGAITPTTQATQQLQQTPTKKSFGIVKKA